MAMSWAKRAAGSAAAANAAPKPDPHTQPAVPTTASTSNQPSQTPPQNSSGHQKSGSVDADGLTHQMRYLCTSVKGRMAVVELKDGRSFEGVLTHVSGSPLRFTLGWVQEQQQQPPSAKSTRNRNKFEERRVFAGGEVLKLSVREEHLKAPLLAGAFRTDKEISNREMKPRVLQKWQDSSAETVEDAEVDVLLDHEPTKKWDQFATNAAMGVDSSFNFAEYSTPLDPNSDNFARQARVAEQIAASIKNKTATNVHVAMDRGQRVENMDEEALFSQVHSNGSAKPKSASAQSNKAVENVSASADGKTAVAVPSAKGVWAKRQHPGTANAPGQGPKTAPSDSTSPSVKKDQRGAGAGAGAGAAKKAAKTKLNPNAKEFTLNPKAKAFTPGGFLPAGAPVLAAPMPHPVPHPHPMGWMNPAMMHAGPPVGPYPQMMGYPPHAPHMPPPRGAVIMGYPPQHVYRMGRMPPQGVPARTPPPPPK